MGEMMVSREEVMSELEALKRRIQELEPSEAQAVAPEPIVQVEPEPIVETEPFVIVEETPIPENLTYKIRYGELDSSTIFNYIETRRNHKAIQCNWPVDDNKRIFYEKLRESIKEEGFRNPILVFSANRVKKDPNKERIDKVRRYYDLGNENQYIVLSRYVPEDHVEQILVCHDIGGTRLFVAQEQGLKIPCLISDFSDMFPDLPEMKTREEIWSKMIER